MARNFAPPPLCVVLFLNHYGSQHLNSHISSREGTLLLSFSILTRVDEIIRQAAPLFLSHVDHFGINRECVDADFRFMAASDLTNELLSPSMEPTLNDAISYKVVDAVLNTLQDKNGEVQNMGVKWYSIEKFWVDYSLSALVPRLKEQQVQMIVDRLSHFTDASNQNAELRDISSTGTQLFVCNVDHSVTYGHH